jgi:hypothetical protein
MEETNQTPNQQPQTPTAPTVQASQIPQTPQPMTSQQPATPQPTEPQPPTPEVPTTSQSPKILLFGVALLLIAIIGAAAYLFYQNQNKQAPQPASYEGCVNAEGSVIQESYPATCITKDGERFLQPLPDDTQNNLQSNFEAPDFESLENWIIFTSNYEYEIKFPAKFEIDTNMLRGSEEFKISSDDEYIALFWKQDLLTDLSVKEKYPYGLAIKASIPKSNQQNLSLNELIHSTLSESDFIERDEIIIDGTKGEKLIYETADGTITDVFFLYKDKLYRFTGRTFSTESKMNNLHVYDDLFNQIMSTIIFLNEEKADGWKTYRIGANDTILSFRAPEDLRVRFSADCCGIEINI